MKLSQRVKVAYNVLTKQTLSNSMGSVIRDFTSESVFNPQKQLRGITYKAVDKIGMSVSKYEAQAKKANGDAYENHPIITLAKNPNEQSNSSDFNHLWAMLYEIYGETFWYLAKGEVTGKVKEVHLLDPSRMELKIYNGELIGYVLHKSDGTQVPFEVDEIIHDKRANPFNAWRGMSVLERASVYVDTELVTSQFTLSYMQNNASPSGIVTLPDMAPETFKQFTAQWREGYEGPQNAGKTAFIRGGEATFKAIGATLKDVDQKITRDMAKEDVLMMLEVPKPLLGMADQTGLGRANVDTLFYIFNKETIDPLMERLDRIWEKIAKLGALNGGLAGELSGIDHVSPIPEDKDYNLLRNEKGVNVWLTINEAREQDGLPPIDGGDEIKEKTPMQFGAQPPPDENNKSKAKKITLKKELTTVEKAKKLNNEQEKFRASLVENNMIYAKKFKSKLSKFASEQEAKIIANFNASTKAYEEWLPNVKEDSVALALILTPIIIELMQAQSEDVANFITGEKLVISPEMRKVVDTKILKIAGVYNADTIKALQSTLTDGQAAGESLAKLKGRVESVYVDAKGYRAERIARTESLRSSNETAEEVYKQNGFSTVKWFANPGACSTCESLDGQTKSIGGNYANIGDVITGNDGSQMRIEYDDIGTPPLHPNCTCSLVPED